MLLVCHVRNSAVLLPLVAVLLAVALLFLCPWCSCGGRGSRRIYALEYRIHNACDRRGSCRSVAGLCIDRSSDNHLRLIRCSLCGTQEERGYGTDVGASFHFVPLKTNADTMKDRADKNRNTATERVKKRTPLTLPRALHDSVVFSLSHSTGFLSESRNQNQRESQLKAVKAKPHRLRTLGYQVLPHLRSRNPRLALLNRTNGCKCLSTRAEPIQSLHLRILYRSNHMVLYSRTNLLLPIPTSAVPQLLIQTIPLLFASK